MNNGVRYLYKVLKFDIPNPTQIASLYFTKIRTRKNASYRKKVQIVRIE